MAEGLFEPGEDGGAPLAIRLRPRTLEEFVGQEEVLGPGTFLRRAIEEDRLQSLVLYGPPGTGKTTLAHIISNVTGAAFEALNAVTDGLPELRAVVERAKQRRALEGRRTLLFVDELHRFNKTQQDGLLPHVEGGLFVMVGATVHNPYFALTPPLRSRSRIVRFDALSDDDLNVVADRALADEERGLGRLNLRLAPEARTFLLLAAEGDARRVLNALEAASLLVEEGGEITAAVIREAAGGRDALYDRDETAHYETISAFIKSMRGSDPDAALYWLARMLAGGEDPRFVARRMVIFASEDVGLADAKAALLAQAAFRAAETIGDAEIPLILGHVTIYLATAPKSNTATRAIGKAMKEVEEGPRREVPLPLRNVPRAGDPDHEDYKYPHRFPGGWVDQEYMPEPVRFYEPGERGDERRIKKYLAWIAEMKSKKEAA
ncbi:MAG: replication-associated recombination protein A [Candidatus Coatesbacteria bacterium]|nr:MAG: replication-associated recombination protein A [Candidatus Coatesbacteria bacterium]